MRRPKPLELLLLHGNSNLKPILHIIKIHTFCHNVLEAHFQPNFSLKSVFRKLSSVGRLCFRRQMFSKQTANQTQILELRTKRRKAFNHLFLSLNRHFLLIVNIRGAHFEKHFVRFGWVIDISNNLDKNMPLDLQALPSSLPAQQNDQASQAEFARRGA